MSAKITDLSRFRLNPMKHSDSCRVGRTKEYRAWANMKHRCVCKNCNQYEDYGGRGIKVCKRWKKFENFLADMGRAPSPRHSIERIDNNGNYEPGNCKWGTKQEQALNRRGNRLINVDGVIKTIHQWQRVMGFGRMTILNRIKAGWSERESVLTPRAKWTPRKQNYS